MKVALIPARGGSKRIPGKNIKLFAGKPIIAYSIEAARRSGLFDRIIVSTDSEQIAEIARMYGAETPFLREAELADDFTATAPVIIHAINWLNSHNCQPEQACCIYATAPFLTTTFLQRGYELLLENESTAFGVTTFSSPIFRALKINKKGCLEMLWPENELVRSNDLPNAYHDAGQFYWLNCSKFLKEKRLYSTNAMPVVIPRKFVLDIDTQEDWDLAELMFKAMKRKNINKLHEDRE